MTPDVQMAAMPVVQAQTYYQGDRVRFLVATHGRHGPQAGQGATIAVGNELDGPRTTVAVVLDGAAASTCAKAWECFRQHLTLVARAPVAGTG